MNKGKLIVIYGSNNLGKTTQAKLLVEKLNQQGLKTEYLKYPIYNCEPTGPQINQILRGGKAQSITEIELQKLYAQNRRDFQPQLEVKLDQSINIVAEDYIGTGLAWGVTKGADLATLEKQNEDLLKEDTVILLDGERFLDGKEQNHLHEQNDEWMAKNRQVHLDLTKKYGWQVVSANQGIEKVAEDIWQKVKPALTY
jgi:dTMP kinase